MNVLERFRWELRSVQWPGETLQPLPGVTRRLRGDGADVCLFVCGEEELDGAIQDEVRHAREMKLDLEWKAFSFDPPSLLGRLESARGTRRR